MGYSDRRPRSPRRPLSATQNNAITTLKICYFYSYGLLHCTEVEGGGRRHDRSRIGTKSGGVCFFFQRSGKRLKSIQVPAFQYCEQERSFFFERAVRMSLCRWRASP